MSPSEPKIYSTPGRIRNWIPAITRNLVGVFLKNDSIVVEEFNCCQAQNIAMIWMSPGFL